MSEGDEMTKDEFKIMDLFSGAGGFSLGFDSPQSLCGLGNLGYKDIGFTNETFRTEFSLDKYSPATNTIKENFPYSETFNGPIENYTSFEDWEDIDIVIGGPPCQGFSNLNSTSTEDLDDERNGLWRDFLRAVEEIQPEVFVIENVPRFLKSEQGALAVRRANNLGYETVVDVLNAVDYGVPQNRKRAFVVGSRVGTPFLPAPTEEPIKTVEDAIGDLPKEPTEENLHRSRNFADITIKRMENVPEGGNRFDIPQDLLPECWKDYENGGRDLFGRLWWDKPSVTIRTSFHKPMKGRHLYPDDDVHRTITLREGARLQTFPDSFEFGNNYQTHISQLIGNAVPPKLAYHIALAVKAHIEGLEGTINHNADTTHEVFQKANLVEEEVLEEYR